jgi:PHD/YefM family antitoxin component YafN of YafNO toxin-antitoxin module
LVFRSTLSSRFFFRQIQVNLHRLKWRKYRILRCVLRQTMLFQSANDGVHAGMGTRHGLGQCMNRAGALSEQNLEQVNACRRQLRERSMRWHENARSGFNKTVKSIIDSTLFSTHNRLVKAKKLTLHWNVMSQLTANDLKTRGVAAIESLLATQPEVMISVRGRDRFVVMDVAHYQYLRECELDAALAQSQADVAAGRFVVESASAHVARLEAMLAADSDAP